MCSKWNWFHKYFKKSCKEICPSLSLSIRRRGRRRARRITIIVIIKKTWAKIRIKKTRPKIRITIIVIIKKTWAKIRIEIRTIKKTWLKRSRSTIIYIEIKIIIKIRRKKAWTKARNKIRKKTWTKIWAKKRAISLSLALKKTWITFTREIITRIKTRTFKTVSSSCSPFISSEKTPKTPIKRSRRNSTIKKRRPLGPHNRRINKN